MIQAEGKNQFRVDSKTFSLCNTDNGRPVPCPGLRPGREGRKKDYQGLITAKNEERVGLLTWASPMISGVLAVPDTDI